VEHQGPRPGPTRHRRHLREHSRRGLPVAELALRAHGTEPFRQRWDSESNGSWPVSSRPGDVVAEHHTGRGATGCRASSEPESANSARTRPRCSSPRPRVRPVARESDSDASRRALPVLGGVPLGCGGPPAGVPARTTRLLVHGRTMAPLVLIPVRSRRSPLRHSRGSAPADAAGKGPADNLHGAGPAGGRSPTCDTSRSGSATTRSNRRPERGI
jgi:hypothetical protein